MGGVFWLLLATVIGAVIFFNIMKVLLTPKEEENPDRPRRPEPTPTDVDRFLAEVNRRRQESQREPAPAPPRPARPEPRRERDRERARERERERSRREQPMRTAPVVRRVSEEQARAFPTVQAVEPMPEVEPETPPKFRGSEVVRDSRPRSAILADVAGLLRNSRSVGAAIVLQEILGPPLSKRRR